MIEKNYKVTSNEGLHARPSSVLVSAVTPFTSDVKLAYMDKTVNLNRLWVLCHWEYQLEPILK